MTELNYADHFRIRPGVRRMKKSNLRVDMTPMVDLGFLLISFFIFTTEISRPSVTNLYMPKDSSDSTHVPGSRSLTFLLGAKNHVYYYEGTTENAFKNKAIIQTSYSVYNGIGDIIRKKQKQLDATVEGRKGLIVLIKPGDQSAYRYVVNVLDEMLINDVKIYSLAEPEAMEKHFLRN